ncbi:hypothetical protein EVAR_37656_1 [Eumeta japonica]|uniref:Uncharacterized protein n=1 Tax=Eumeta variegata TaxID=151549 RepID=A0A4C1VQZ2_EUMVA|nr:hypothetical protein EVAR_37656_1 [Eumeta japonica]
MLRRAGGATSMDKVRNEHILETFKFAPIQEIICESRLRWCGHVMRRDDDHINKRTSNISWGKSGQARACPRVMSSFQIEGLVPHCDPHLLRVVIIRINCDIKERHTEISTRKCFFLRVERAHGVRRRIEIAPHMAQIEYGSRCSLSSNE